MVRKLEETQLCMQKKSKSKLLRVSHTSLSRSALSSVRLRHLQNSVTLVAHACVCLCNSPLPLCSPLQEIQIADIRVFIVVLTIFLTAVVFTVIVITLRSLEPWSDCADAVVTRLLLRLFTCQVLNGLQTNKEMCVQFLKGLNYFIQEWRAYLVLLG